MKEALIEVEWKPRQTRMTLFGMALKAVPHEALVLRQAHKHVDLLTESRT